MLKNSSNDNEREKMADPERRRNRERQKQERSEMIGNGGQSPIIAKEIGDCPYIQVIVYKFYK